MKKILSISLAFILLLSNVGFTMATHFCSGLAVKSELMIGHDHLYCGMPDMDKKTDCDADKGVQLQAQPCCENQYQTFEVEDDFKLNLEQTTLNPEFVTAYVYTFLNLTAKDSLKRKFTKYAPPILHRDIPVLNQTFLI